MVSFAEYKKSGALEAKKSACEAEEVIKARRATESRTTGTRNNIALPDGNGLGSLIVPLNAPGTGTGLANTKPNGAPSTTKRTAKTPIHLRPVFSTVECAGKVIVKVTEAPAWGQSKVVTGVAFVKPRLKNSEIFEPTFPRLPTTTVPTKHVKAWTPPRPGSPSYKARMEKIGFKVPLTIGSATSLETSKPFTVTSSTILPETNKPRSRRYKRNEGYRYAKEAIQDTREEAKNRELSLWKPDEKWYVAGVLKHNDKTFYELVDKYKLPGSFELVLQKVEFYHLPFEITSTEYVLMGDMIAEIEACKVTNKWVEQTRLSYEQRIREEEQAERRRQQDIERRTRWKEEARAKKEVADREKALKAGGRKINPTNNFMKDLVKNDKIAEGKARTRTEKLWAAIVPSSEAPKEPRTSVDPVVNTTAAKGVKDEIVKKEAVESSKKPSEFLSTKKTSTKRRVEEIEPVEQEVVPKAKRYLKSNSPGKAGRSVSYSASLPRKASSALATTRTTQTPKKKARTQEPIQDSDSPMNDADVLQDRYIHIPPDTDNDDELPIIAGAYLNECSQAPAKVQSKSLECRKLTAKRLCTKKAPKVEEKTQWVESDDEVTDSEDERWQQNFCKKAAEYKARKADIGESDSDAEVGTARVVRKRKSPSDSDEDSGTEKVDDLSNFIVDTPDYVPARHPKKAQTSESTKNSAPRKADLSKYVAGLW